MGAGGEKERSESGCVLKTGNFNITSIYKNLNGLDSFQIADTRVFHTMIKVLLPLSPPRSLLISSPTLLYAFLLSLQKSNRQMKKSNKPECNKTNSKKEKKRKGRSLKSAHLCTHTQSQSHSHIQIQSHTHRHRVTHTDTQYQTDSHIHRHTHRYIVTHTVTHRHIVTLIDTHRYRVTQNRHAVTHRKAIKTQH